MLVRRGRSHDVFEHGFFSDDGLDFSTRIALGLGSNPHARAHVRLAGAAADLTVTLQREANSA
jgi:hypothetical protein